jgi:hypothetical protein
MDFSVCAVSETCFNKPLSSNGRPLRYSGSYAARHNIILSIVHFIPSAFIKIILQHRLFSMFRPRTGRAIAQAVSRWVPTGAALVRAQIKSCGVCGGQSGTGAGFLRLLRFSLPIYIPPSAPHSSSSLIRGCYNRPMTDVPSGLSLTPPHETEKKN